MTIEMLYSKIHRATVTDANLNYVGSITIDEELMQAAKMRIGQKVEILNVNNGERFSTYVILGERGKRDICLNGAAARKVHKGDKVIIVAYASYDEKELESYKPTVVILNDENNIDYVAENI
jgi:aspartate 1-decarboxylase